MENINIIHQSEEATFSDNWMLDETRKTHAEFGDKNENLIVQNTIEKIKYGRMCVNMFFAQMPSKTEEIEAYHINFDTILLGVINKIKSDSGIK